MIQYLNLLPEEHKKKIALNKFLKFLRKETAFVCILLLFGSGLVFYIEQYLDKTLREMDYILEKNQQQHKSLIENIRQFNVQIENFRSIEDKFSRYSKFFLDLTTMIPKGIKFDSISLNDKQEIEIKGAYAKRDELIIFKHLLEDNFITDIYFPITNLLKQEKGNFVIRGRINYKES